MKQRVLDQDMFGTQTSGRAARLETPSVAGFHNGMQSCSLIGRRLGTMFEVPRDASGAIEALLRQLEQKLCR